jgi:hypothetical protein
LLLHLLLLLLLLVGHQLTTDALLVSSYFR